ncbi:MAG: hypothetical protein H6744_13145 [Deltaproteobacteria bacterium]|nr:hypothetical protein [Deltaproteobacteria bacterium]
MAAGPATPPAPASATDPQGRPTLASAPAGSAEAAARALAAANDAPELPQPVYALDGSANPLAARLCEALHTLPARRRAACSERKSLGYLVTGDCTAMLSAALAQGALKLSESSVTACENAMSEAYAGCDWMGPLPASVPTACDGILSGGLSAGRTCRSALECSPGLACRGLAPTTPGVCAPPAHRGHACQTGIDPLAALTRQHSAAHTHPECEGYCAHHRCQDATAANAPCRTNLECGPTAHCAAGACTEDPAAPNCPNGGC